MFELTQQHKINRALRLKLREACASAQRDAAVFTVLTVLLTPLAVALFIFALLFAFAFVDLPVIDHLGYEFSFVFGANLCLAFMSASYFLRPKHQLKRNVDDNVWLLSGFGIFCAILALSYLTPFVLTHPGWFWSLYLLLAMVMLSFIGYAYEPHDDYYLGWTAGPILIDDPFTFQDDIDRAHIGLGFAVSMSHLILEAYGAIFASRWLWRGLQESELAASAALLQGLAVQDSSGGMAHLHELGKKSAADIVRALVKLELVVIDKGRPRLSRKGKEFLELRLDGSLRMSNA